MNKNFLRLCALVTSAAIFLVTGDALAGQPHDWQINFQPPVTPVAEEMQKFHNFLLYIIAAIAAFVSVLLLIVIFKFNAKANPEPRKFTHNTMLEVIWTLIPCIILLVIAVPSIQLLFLQDRTVNPEMTLKITGYQWYWGYEYPDHEDINFMSYMIPDDEIKKEKGQLRLLSTDAPVVIPVDTDIQILITAADVLHAFAMPAFGIKMDAVPGRINETWARVTKTGRYFGQCSELCGKDHGYMPIEVIVVPKEMFDKWSEIAQEDVEAASTFIRNETKSYLEFELTQKEGL